MLLLWPWASFSHLRVGRVSRAMTETSDPEVSLENRSVALFLLSLRCRLWMCKCWWVFWHVEATADIVSALNWCLCLQGPRGLLGPKGPPGISGPPVSQECDCTNILSLLQTPTHIQRHCCYFCIAGKSLCYHRTTAAPAKQYIMSGNIGSDVRPPANWQK